ncbi:MAG: homoserine O-acetyltransferase MetX [Planctomycetota bacterium]
MGDFFDSSDANRTNGPRPHARTMTFDRPLRLELGGELASVTVCYETYGTLSDGRDNAVLICHALSGDAHVAAHDENDAPGWWEVAVGPGKAIDTDRYFVIGANVLGGCYGTTGPGAINPATGEPYGPDFPAITIGDMVEVQRMLVDALGIERLLAVVGGSMGGMQVLQWAVAYPDRVRAAVPIATTRRLAAQALAFDVVGRNAIRSDPGFHGGRYYDKPGGPSDGLALARMIGHITYLSRQSMDEKFDADRHEPRPVAYAYESRYSVGSYLAYQGGRFVERFDANAYITLSLAMDAFDLAAVYGSLNAALRRATCRWLVISFDSDWLFPPAQSRQLVNAVIATERPVTYCNIHTRCGHDAFLLADDLDMYGGLMEAFLARTLNGRAETNDAAGPWHLHPDVRSIFHGNRIDLDRIVSLIPEGVGVLDLGCGDGEVMSRLRRRGTRDLLGVEVSAEAVLTCARRGLDVVQHDLRDGLGPFRDKQFEIVLLSQTLQTVRRPDRLLLEMLRVGEKGIVSFPNFAHRESRRQLVEEGIAPVTGGLPFTWYASPNVRFLSIKDFELLCAELGITIHRRIALDTTAGREVNDEVNLNADTAIFVLSRG